MKYPDLSRYDMVQLTNMLYSYRSLARDHSEAGHFALAKWAQSMATHVTIEMNKQAMVEENRKNAQLRLDD